MALATIQRACAKLRSAIGDEAVVRLNFTADLRDMLESLEYIQPVLGKAEMEPLRDRLESAWLWRVRATAYNIMDIVNELQDAATMTRMLPRLAIMKNALATKMDQAKILVRIIQMWCPIFDSMELDTISQQIIEERKTEPSVEEALVFGRGSDKQRIVTMLLSAASNITQEPIIIFPIYGLAGSGKTTLAQMVFNDTHSLQGYDFRVWVQVWPELDFHTIGESIIRQVSGAGGGGHEHINTASSHVVGIENIMKCLHELLNGKKVLLVLDDLWEEDSIQLQLLKSMLTFLGDKVDVIVTTCNQAIARKICTVEPYRLNPLSDETCWEIIKKSILFREEKEDEGEGEGEEDLEKMGREIASKCQGVPSVARAYAGMLDSSRDAITWRKIMETNIWLNIYIADSTYSLPLSTFELSFLSMPPDLRLCCGYYCKIFPNGHNIAKDDLVHQWIALQVIEPSETLSTTQIAGEYITRLLDMSFLQTAKSGHTGGKDDKGVILFTMHTLVHDFARRFLESLSYCIATNHHGKLDEFYNNLRALHCVGCSKMEFNDDSFSRRKSLRVLELKESSVQKLPDSIWQLSYLGYLKISEFTGLVTLPKSFDHLINLLHIDLSGCSGLLHLPETFGKLIRLVHVNLSGCSGLATLPESFQNLINLSHVDLSRCHGLAEIPEPLQKLYKLVHLDLSFWSCFEGIEKGLGGLTNLQHLNLSHPCCYLPQHRSHLKGLKHGLCKLTKLRYLNLSMCLNPMFQYYQSKEDRLQYIGECIKGLSALEHLDLSQNTFLSDLPERLSDLNKLQTLNLSGCIRLKKVDELKSVKFISLKNCRGLESCSFMVRVDDLAPYISSNIVQLEGVNCQELQISCLENVRSKDEARIIKLVEKQKLEKLKLSWTLDSLRSVEDSALLEELVPTNTVQCLELHGYNGICLPEYLSDLTSLRELKIVCCAQLNSLPDGIQKLTNLKDLRIFDCPDLKKWCQLEENKKLLAHIPNKNYEEHAGTSRPEIEEDCR